MSKGRRLALLQQARLAWASDADYLTYIESGALKRLRLSTPPNPLADRIAADILANGGKLIVDEKRFGKLAVEIDAGTKREEA